MQARSIVGLMCFLAVGCGGMAEPDIDTSSSALKKKSPLPGGRDRCAARAPSVAEQEAIERDLAASGAQRQVTGVVNVPVYIHVVKASDGQGTLLPKWLTDQMDVLNAAYANAGFQFQLVSQDEVTNDAWYFSVLGSAEEQQMKASLRQGGADALNIYTTAGDVYLGWATFPVWYRGPLKTYDGVVIWWASLPGTGLGGPNPNEPDGFLTYDQGDTVTHEVGHWLGLYHTFEGSCNKNGDRIDDTPAEFEPNFFCVENIDSCTGKKFPGVDPIHNFMDYGDDVCLDHFTPDQQERMQKQWRVYRAKGT
jgi:hypothetical protein